MENMTMSTTMTTSLLTAPAELKQNTVTQFLESISNTTAALFNTTAAMASTTAAVVNATVSMNLTEAVLSSTTPMPTNETQSFNTTVNDVAASDSQRGHTWPLYILIASIIISLVTLLYLAAKKLILKCKSKTSETYEPVLMVSPSSGNTEDDEDEYVRLASPTTTDACVRIKRDGTMGPPRREETAGVIKVERTRPKEPKQTSITTNADVHTDVKKREKDEEAGATSQANRVSDASSTAILREDDIPYVDEEEAASAQ